MGAAESGQTSSHGPHGTLLDSSMPFCCGTGASFEACQRHGGQGNEILRAPAMQYNPSDKLNNEVPQWHPPGALAAATLESKIDSRSGGGNAMADGEIEEKYEDGSIYVGQIVNSKRHGRGVWTSPSEEYTGQWKDDQREGQGKQTWHDGRIYEGQFKAGKFHGHGKMEWHMPNGLMVYEGQYVDDQKDGYGKYIWPDQRIYDGEWKKGNREGQATFTLSCGQSRRSIWKANKVEKWLEDEPRP